MGRRLDLPMGRPCLSQHDCQWRCACATKRASSRRVGRVNGLSVPHPYVGVAAGPAARGSLGVWWAGGGICCTGRFVLHGGPTIPPFGGRAASHRPLRSAARRLPTRLWRLSRWGVNSWDTAGCLVRSASVDQPPGMACLYAGRAGGLGDKASCLVRMRQCRPAPADCHVTIVSGYVSLKSCVSGRSCPLPP